MTVVSALSVNVVVKTEKMRRFRNKEEIFAYVNFKQIEAHLHNESLANLTDRPAEFLECTQNCDLF